MSSYVQKKKFSYKNLVLTQSVPETARRSFRSCFMSEDWFTFGISFHDQKRSYLHLRSTRVLGHFSIACTWSAIKALDKATTMSTTSNTTRKAGADKEMEFVVNVLPHIYSNMAHATWKYQVRDCFTCCLSSVDAWFERVRVRAMLLMESWLCFIRHSAVN